MKKRGTPNRKTNTQPPRGNWANAYARARMKAGLTQEEACRELHIDQKFISEIENFKRNPPPDIAIGMARLYNDDRLIRKPCREVCAIGRARKLVFDLNLKIAIPLMMRRFEEVLGVLNQLPFLLEGKEHAWDFAPEEWELLLDYASRIRKFSRDVEILEACVDRFIEKAEEKMAACGAARQQ